MIELDYDKVLEELLNQAKNPELDEIPDILERYLQNIAKTGDTIFPWSKVKLFIRKKMEIVMESFHEKYPLNDAHVSVPNCDPFDYNGIKNNILNSFDWFLAAPFTIQRLCELLIEPELHYKRTDKFLRGIEKNVIVVSTIQPQPNKYSTPETIEKQTSFKDIYPQFSLRSRSSAIPLSMLTRSPTDNSSSSCSSSSSTSPSNNTSNSLMANGFDNHHHLSHHHNNHHALQNNNGLFPVAYSLQHLASTNSNTGNNFSYDDSSNNGTSMSHSNHHQDSSPSINNPVLNNYGTGSSSPNNTTDSLSAPLQQLNSFTNVFVTSTYLTNQINNHQTLTTSASNLHRQQQSQPQRNFDWSANAGHCNISSTELPGDENENIIVDDDYEQQSGIEKNESLEMYHQRLAGNHSHGSLLTNYIEPTGNDSSDSNDSAKDTNQSCLDEHNSSDSNSSESSDSTVPKSDTQQEEHLEEAKELSKLVKENQINFNQAMSNVENEKKRFTEQKLVDNENGLQPTKSDDNLEHTTQSTSTEIIGLNKKFKLLSEGEEEKIEADEMEKSLDEDVDDEDNNEENIKMDENLPETLISKQQEQDDLPMDMTQNTGKMADIEQMEHDDKMIKEEAMTISGSLSQQPMNVELNNIDNNNTEQNDEDMSEPMEQE